MINNRSKTSSELSKVLYLKDKEIYFLGFYFLGLAGILKFPSVRTKYSKTKNNAKPSVRFRCILTNQRLINSKSRKITRMIYKIMLNTSKINGIRVAKR